MSAEFIQLISEANVPEEIATSLEGFDIALFARSCESADELELFIQHAIASAGVTQLPQKMLAKASIRLLFSGCRTAENLPHLVGFHVRRAPRRSHSACCTGTHSRFHLMARSMASKAQR